jgi:hypothetical protein
LVANAFRFVPLKIKIFLVCVNKGMNECYVVFKVVDDDDVDVVVVVVFFDGDELVVGFETTTKST